MAGDANDAIGPDQVARFGVWGIVLTDVRAVASGFDRKLGTVIQDKGNVAALDDGAQHVTGAADSVVIHVFEPQLDAGDIAGVQCRRKNGQERRRVEPWRRNQI